MSAEVVRNAAAVELLLELLELPEPVLSGAGAKLVPAASDILVSAGLLIPHDVEHVTVSLGDHDDVPTSVAWSDQFNSMTYFSPALGVIPIQIDLLQRRRVEIEAALIGVCADLNLAGNDQPFDLFNGLLWEVGNARLGRRRDRVPIWFARRLWDPIVQQHVKATALARPHLRLRVILTSTVAPRARDVIIPGHIVIPLRDVLAAPGGLEADPQILEALLDGSRPPNQSGPVTLSPDGSRLTINGTMVIQFKSTPQIAAIRSLVQAYLKGCSVRAADLTDHGSLSRLFGHKKWLLLAPYLKSRGGAWGFDL